ncbi:hypothetical protein AAZX31_19G139100 [Glycine max]|uniref:Fe2OG dioxygenase domain-containing protein n=3 Tax=Glycine subgen. Soja TaxID=1462606 RepID=I1N9E3_SOYBN|nr:RNA demethylase ALKBH10B [Glycine max]XP_028219047.1 RNA demethylase ALKBH10B-like [Glycine soja]KAG5083536.1 hypothetical protein JHK84_053574 [Glycine max]KAG5086307.1 hypothetical protein JHK82_053704 [Glycine max]RZB48075.1 hypothetical protein D0Y65_051563 [Glycine soja]|eukprot:XP_006604415.1 uncharacterized protein LOC100776159 [Glycine max]
MAAVPASRTDPPPAMVQPPLLVSDPFAKDAILAWFHGEFAAANAIIDALCGHLAHLAAASSDYDAAFAAIHRRRLNWIPVIQMQKYHSIADVTLELRRVAEKKSEHEAAKKSESSFEEEGKLEKETAENGGNDGDDDAAPEYDSPDSEITDSGSQEMQPSVMNNNICSNHEECEGRSSQIKLTKGFTAKESVKGHMVNVVKGLKLYEDVFSESEICKLTDFVKEIHAAAQNGELSGETFILFNKQMKGNKRELIQLGVPIFRQIKDDNKSNIEPIPALLHDVIDHLIQWKLIPEYKRPNGCIINFFEEGEFSQPFLKPPHLDQPLSTLLLSESTMAFGRILMSENDGNYKGPLMLSLKEGSLLVMRGNSADMARHVMCPSPNRRVSITFFRVRPDSNQCQSPTPTMTTAMTLWQPSIASPFTLPNGPLSGYEAMNMMPQLGILSAPMVMLAPMRPMAANTHKLPRGGTGVFLPWKGSARKHARHLPPRAQKGRLMELPSPVESHTGESISEPSIAVEG